MHVINDNARDLSREVVEPLLYGAKFTAERPIRLSFNFICRRANLKQDDGETGR